MGRREGEQGRQEKEKQARKAQRRTPFSRRGVWGLSRIWRKIGSGWQGCPYETPASRGNL
jgi:hypothetical protein